MTDQDKTALLSKLRAEGVQAGDERAVAHPARKVELLEQVAHYADLCCAFLRDAGYVGKADALTSRIKAVIDLDGEIGGPVADKRAAENHFEDELERAYWEMDARIKGLGKHKGRPQPDRDAFKWAVRAMQPMPSKAAREYICICCNVPRNNCDCEPETATLASAPVAEKPALENVADAAIKAAYVEHFGHADGWLGEPGSWFIEGFWVGRKTGTASAPVADTLPLEKALYELVDKIAPGLDTGDLVQDARRASTLLSAIMASAPVAALTDAAILHRSATHVGQPDAARPLTDADKIAFARAVLADAGAPVAREAKKPVAWLYRDCGFPSRYGYEYRDVLSATLLDHYYTGPDGKYVKGEPLYAAPQASEAVLDAVQFVLKTFKTDEAQGFRSRDRQFAISILESALKPQHTAEGE